MGDYDDLMNWGTKAPAASAPATPAADPYADLMKWGTPEQPAHSTAQDFARGAVQGASLGFGDELSALIDTATSKIPGVRNVAQHLHADDLPPLTGDATYQERRDAYRAKNAAAHESSPYAYLGGNIAGGLALTPLIPGGAPAKTLVGAIGKGIKAGAALGGVNALGSSNADLTQGDVGGTARDVASGAALGGLTGGLFGAAGHLGAKALTNNAEKLKKWIGSDLVGETKGASTTTAKIQMSNDLDDIADVVSKDPKLDAAVFAAQKQHPDALSNAIDAVDAKIKDVTAPRAQMWEQFDQELAGASPVAAPAAARPLAKGNYTPEEWDAIAGEWGGKHAPELDNHGTVGGGTVKGGGPTVEDVNAAPTATGPAGVRAGDYVDHLEQAVEDLRATGKGSDRAVAAELQHHISELKTARDWGYQPAAGNPEEAQILTNLQAQRTARLARGEGTAEVDNAIREMTANAKAWDPDHVVPAVRIRDDVTDLQREAAQRMGGIHGTPNYLRGREVASHGEEFLRDLTAQVAQRNPELAAQIAQHNREYSALANMKQILQQRLQRAKVDDIGGLGTGIVAKAAKLGTKHGIVKAGSLLAGRGLVSTIRAGQRMGANLEGSAASGDKFSILVLDGLRKGLPLAASVAAAEAAGRAAGD